GDSSDASHWCIRCRLIDATDQQSPTTLRSANFEPILPFGLRFAFSFGQITFVNIGDRRYDLRVAKLVKFGKYCPGKIHEFSTATDHYRRTMIEPFGVYVGRQ